VEEETEMRSNGTWETHQQRLMYENSISKVKDAINELQSFHDTVSNPQIHFQDGRFEEWKVGQEQVKEDLREEIGKLEAWLIELHKELEELDK